MSLKAYLAEKYMSGPKAYAILSKVNPPKKKKRKATAASTSASSASFIKDDDLTGWADTPQDGEDDDMAEAVVAEDRRFKKRQRTEADSGWQTVRDGEGGSKTPPPAEDEQPQVVKTEEEPFKGGLLTSAQLKKKLPKASKQEKRSAEEEAAERAAAQETVYRDSSGRKVDMAAAKAEAARLKREREEKEAKKMEWGKGLVQREDAEKRRKEEEAMRNRAFARTVDDKELNEELKAQDRWNDPAAAFLTKKRSKGPRKPEYTGPPPPPNRFGIRPGYRWDGVDRSNGFEKKYFQKQNDRRRRGAESYEYSVDDM